MITTEQRNALKAAALAATPGPWTSYGCYVNDQAGKINIYDEGGHSEADATYIAAANPATILSLIAAVESAAAPQPAQAALSASKIEEIAKALYRKLPEQKGKSPPDYPWQDGGNSQMQELARDMARAAIAASHQPAAASSPTLEAAPAATFEGWMDCGDGLRPLITVTGNLTAGDVLCVRRPSPEARDNKQGESK